MTIDLAALLAEIAAHPAADDGAYTLAEIRASTGYGLALARRAVAAAIAAGQCEPLRTPRRDMTGTVRMVQGYKFRGAE